MLIPPQLSKSLIVVYYGVWLDDTMFGIATLCISVYICCGSIYPAISCAVITVSAKAVSLSIIGLRYSLAITILPPIRAIAIDVLNVLMTGQFSHRLSNPMVHINNHIRLHSIMFLIATSIAYGTSNIMLIGGAFVIDYATAVIVCLFKPP